LLFATFIFTKNLHAQDALNRSVQVSVKHETNPARLEFTWPWDWSEGGYSIYKKHMDSLSWGQPIATLPWGSTGFTDYDVPGLAPAEYAFYKKGFERITRNVTVPSGSTLVFTINNNNGNGICCNFGHGWYLTQACEQILSGGSDFGFAKSDTITVCDQGSPTETLTITINPDMLTQNTWWKLKTLAGQTVDSSGVPGSNLAEKPKFGYILAGPYSIPVDKRGSLLLVVDDEYTLPLQAEIQQLEQDFWGDGWRVKRLTVSRNDAVTAVKSLIVNAYDQTPDLKMVYLLGHVPVPYSGNFYADGHIENHWGAWPADVYYGEMDGTWTDATATNTSATFSRNHNLPGDGKFDQSSIPTAVELAVGRVDLFGMPAFGLSDVELTRRYLNKAHKFKTGQHSVPRRALVDDNLGIALGAPAASGWRNFAPMFTADSVKALDYFSTMKNGGYLWSFGGGSGTHTSANGIGNTQDFVNDTLRNIFTLLCGSQFGDWDNPDNFLRAPLASPGWTLTSCWAGNPPFTLHRMAMGEPIGESLLCTQNATESDYYPGPQLVHTALMGDPTLRLHPIGPVENLGLAPYGSGVKLTWSPPANDYISHYRVYRFDSLQGDFVNLSFQVLDTFFIDSPLPSPNLKYMVRGVKWENSASGSYWNMSLGSFVETTNPCSPDGTFTHVPVSMCEGETYQIQDSTYSASGTYTHHFTSQIGCDSNVVLYLTVHPTVVVNIDSHYVPPLVIDGTNYYTDLTFIQNFLAENGCDSIVNWNFYPIVITEQPIAEQSINIYPNPTSGHFFIENKMPNEALEVEIWDGVGRRVFAGKTKVVERCEFDLSHLPSGVYRIRINGILCKVLILMKL